MGAYQEALDRIQKAKDTSETELDLSGLGLTSLPPEIGQLTNLRELNLSANRLTSLPPETGQLVNLKELDLGFNCLRVVLPFVVWEHDPQEFKQRLGVFLSICHKRGLKVMFTLFDDCAFGSDDKLKNPTYGPQPEVLEGWYANGWTPSPGHDMVREPTPWPRLGG